jgi:hypothetical protein
MKNSIKKEKGEKSKMISAAKKPDRELKNILLARIDQNR